MIVKRAVILSKGTKEKVFDSATAASEFLKASLPEVINTCKGRQHSCRGYKVRYQEDELDLF